MGKYWHPGEDGKPGTWEDYPRSAIRRNHQAKWPMTTTFGGVNPDQAGELRDHWKQHGVQGCEVNEKTGDVTWLSKGARKADMKSRGLIDRNSYNGY